MGLLESLQAKLHGARDWPPVEVKQHWEEVEFYRARFDNEAATLIQHNSRTDPGDLYTPIPVAREMARLSSALLFSEPPEITHETLQAEIDELKELNRLEARLQSLGETVAAEGSAGFRVIRDDSLSDKPLITYVNEDQVIWDVRHGMFVAGGVVVVERPVGRTDVYRLLEEHGAGYVRRELYKGSAWKLGTRLELDSEEAENKVPEWYDLPDEEDTGLNTPTLVRWQNVPGGYADIAGIESLLDRLDEAESLLLDKGRKSVPVTFANEALIERGGGTFAGIVFGKVETQMLGDEGKGSLAETIQPGLQSSDHIAWIEHLRELSLTSAGYSLATWGLDEGGSADSGKALKLRQQRTLLTRAAKARMARQAIAETVAIALAWDAGASEVREFRPEVELGTGLPEDTLERAQEIQTLDSAKAISTEEKVRRLNPGMSDEEVTAEVQRISGEARAGDTRSALERALNDEPF